MKKVNKILIVINALLLVLLTISFFTKPSKDNRKSVKTVLLNPKYKDSIYEFSIENKDPGITIAKDKSGYWVIRPDFSDPENNLLCNQEKVETFLKELQSVVKMHKISDKLNIPDYFSENNTQTLTYLFSTPESNYNSTHLQFGDYDFSKTERYFCNIGSPNGTYCISTEFDKYLTASVQYWANPALIPQISEYFKASDLQRVLYTDLNTKVITSKSPDWNTFSQKAFELYHAGACEEDSEEQLLQIIFEFGNNYYIETTIYTTQGNEYNFFVNYYSPDSKLIYNQQSKISAWTLGMIKAGKAD